MLSIELNEREKNILRYVIQQFILTAAPVGSSNITKKYNIGISPATVRNIMADLEDNGFINHPHTSAGRIPTDKGYRFYVDSLMNIEHIKNSDKKYIQQSLESDGIEKEEFFRIASKLLSSITKQLAYVSYPKFESAQLEKLQIVQLSPFRILVVISIRQGLVKTITLELSTSAKDSQIDRIQSILNEKLIGLTFKEIRETFSERFKDIDDEQKPIIRLFVDSIDKIFKEFKTNENILMSGAKNVIRQPEFEDPERFQSVIELIEDKDIIIHILEKSNDANGVFISIGEENQHQKLSDYSFISKEYKMGNISGTMGVVGPKRMDYSKIIAIVDYVAKLLSNVLRTEN